MLRQKNEKNERKLWFDQLPHAVASAIYSAKDEASIRRKRDSVALLYTNRRLHIVSGFQCSCVDTWAEGRRHGPVLHALIQTHYSAWV
jgi:hypothetical protein